MKKLLDYAHLTVDKVNRNQALDDYENLKPNGKISIVSHAKAIKRLYNIKDRMDTLISKLPKNLMISGSTALACVVQGYDIKPRDIDLYINDNDHNIVMQIDSAIRSTYDDTEIILVRTQYTINWFLKGGEGRNYPSIQLVLPPARHWSEVFSSYHSDLVCIGFLVGEEKFVYARGRWDRFYETGVSYGTTSFIDEEYKQRVIDAIAKYAGYGFDIEVVSAESTIVDNEIENSPMIEVRTAFEDLEQFLFENPQVSVGKFLYNIYSGEIFKDYVETMSIFNRCPNCNELIVGSKICEPCSQEEMKKLMFVRGVLQSSDKDLRYLVTGGRCGLGNEIAKVLLACGRDVTVTSRFPQLTEGRKTVKLDLKDSKSVEEFEKSLENFDVVILSAAETLHYPSSNPPLGANKEDKLDWTNDFHRNDTGIWHKCIDEHANEEIEDPIQINITSIAKIIRSFVAQQIKNKSPKQKSIVYVTSAEGVFMEKSPFHPVTNMTKSAIEQLICTMKRQADVLGMNIVMADPGWMYTKSTNGKNIGPITLEWGAAQILLPLATILSGQKVENASLWNRRKKDSAVNFSNIFQSTEIVKFKGVGETCPATLDDSNIMVLLKPCSHKVGLPGWFQMKKTGYEVRCPMCRSNVESTDIVQVPEKIQEEPLIQKRDRSEDDEIEFIGASKLKDFKHDDNTFE